MLHIKVSLRLVNLVGQVMLGTRLLEYMTSRKSETFSSESHFRRSILKSPSNITSLFSLINFSERGFRYLSLNSLLYTWMSIYASYYHIFGVLLDYFNKNRLQFPFLYIFKSGLSLQLTAFLIYNSTPPSLMKKVTDV